jgi:hypothetical protein
VEFRGITENGIIWDIMGNNGRQWAEGVFYGKKPIFSIS